MRHFGLFSNNVNFVVRRTETITWVYRNGFSLGNRAESKRDAQKKKKA